jgi:hypothetical protein
LFDEIIELFLDAPECLVAQMRIPGQGEKDSGVNVKTIPG